MANQYKNKVVYFGETLIDISADTVTPEALLEGYTAHDKSGVPITGAYVPSGASLQSKTVNPTTVPQVITPDQGYDGLSQVTVNAMPSFVTYRTGSSAPSDSLGSDGDIYLQTS